MGHAQPDLSRRQLLRGAITRPATSAIRPPWALDESAFLTTCTRCDDCIAVCHAKIIRRGDGGYPEISFKRAGCDFCGDCLIACKPAALWRDPNQPENALPWSLQITIAPQCLPLNGVVCRSCGEACEPRAIHFKLSIGGRAEPRLDADQCTGCGECFSVCPIHAISIQPASPPTEECAS
ncbi:ferredoxin-type protein NapF [Magnetofaba australis]|uniref:ferredoxin-type protein NapF n=1 Tax=Magnetofaba australis TaxID=1472297 RepID=UPI000A19D5F2|nr:ferredoxin-type protein NapF [Magnetofaba australis]